MTKSTITRERIQRIIRAIDSEAYDEEEIREWLSSDEIMELARMALSAMDSEPEYLPLDYLQGQKDGLEWAAQLAEANHPETGDWLYDDPIELAKAIRKGPDMPPAQPVADSEPVIVVGDDGGDALSYRRLIQSFEPGTKLYLHAQSVPVVSADLLHTAASAIEDLLTTKDRTGACVWFDLPFRLRSAANAHSAPVVPDDVLAALQKVARIRLDLNDFDGDRRGIADCLCDAEEELIEVVNRRAAMLQELKKSAGTEAICRSDENVQVLHTKSPAQSDCCPAQNDVAPAQSPIDHGYLPECECSGCKATARICAELAGNSQVIPDGYVMVPDDLKEAAADLLATLDDYQEQLVPINRDSSVVRALRAAMLAAAQQEVKGE